MSHESRKQKDFNIHTEIKVLQHVITRGSITHLLPPPRDVSVDNSKTTISKQLAMRHKHN